MTFRRPLTEDDYTTPAKQFVRPPAKGPDYLSLRKGWRRRSLVWKTYESRIFSGAGGKFVWHLLRSAGPPNFPSADYHLRFCHGGRSGVRDAVSVERRGGRTGRCRESERWKFYLLWIL